MNLRRQRDTFRTDKPPPLRDPGRRAAMEPRQAQACVTVMQGTARGGAA
jgi:hypothetical protein